LSRIRLILAVAAAAAVTAPASAIATVLAPDALTHAREIRAAVNARYRHAPGRKLVVTEATRIAPVGWTLTLWVGDPVEPFRVVPAENGIYFSICSARATCPYPPRWAALHAVAFSPRRLALELALRTFLKTSVSVVVVALPTAEPLWLVVEREDLLGSADARSLVDRLIDHPTVGDTELRNVVDRLTLSRLFRPLPVLPLPDRTFYAASFGTTQ
jgi:hypothetical protein